MDMLKLSKRKPKFTQNPYFKFFASVRFAIPSLFAFAAAMTYGTVCESIYGTEYARFAVYHSWWFYLIQAAISASILLSLIDRIPFRKKLSGFYAVHFSMVVMLVGALVTQVWGIDGSIELSPDVPTSRVRMPENAIYLTDGQTEYSTELPNVSRSVRLDGEIEIGGAKASLLRYLPFAGIRKEWKKSPGAWSSEWLVKSPQFEQRVELVDGAPASITEQAGTEQSGGSHQADVGPLHIEVVSADFLKILQEAVAQPKFAIFLVDVSTGKLQGIPQFSGEYRIHFPGTSVAVLSRMEHGAGMSLFRLKVGGRNYTFVPSFSPMPLDEKLAIDRSAAYRLISLGAMTGRNTVFIARLARAKTDGSDAIRIVYGKGNQWSVADYDGGVLTLPWMMGLQLRLVNEKKDAVRDGVLDSVTPNKDDQNNMRAVLVNVAVKGRSEEQWVTNRADTRFELAPIQGFIGNREIGLPFSMRLDRFKMDEVPGTGRPASYESFITVQDGNEQKKIHIFMNNPFKSNGYTFYQSSYFQDERGRYHSVLSVNKDPGRPIKYAGALLLVLAMIIHFLILYGHIRFEEVKR